MAISTGKVVALIQAMGSSADPAVIESAVQDWLDNHPEATTTVQDGSITEQKLASAVAAKLAEVTGLKSAINDLTTTEIEWLKPDAITRNSYYKNAEGETGYVTGKVIFDIAIPLVAGTEYYYKDIDTRYSWFKYENGTSGSITTGNAQTGSGSFVAPDNGVMYVSVMNDYVETALFTSSQAVYERGSQEDLLAVKTDSDLEDMALPANAKATGDQLRTIGGKVTAMNPTAQDSDVGKAIIVKTVENGAASEFEYGSVGKAFVEKEKINILADLGWTGNTSDPIPVEYGEVLTFSFAPYNYRIYMLDANGTSLGELSTFAGLTRTDTWSYYRMKYVYTVVDESVAFIRFHNMPKPSSGVIYRGEYDFDFDMPDEKTSYVEPNLGELRGALTGEYPIGFADMDAEMQTKIGQLGYTDKLADEADLYGYDAETNQLALKDGVLYCKDATSFGDSLHIIYFDENVYAVELTFGVNIVTGTSSNNKSDSPGILLQSNEGQSAWLAGWNTTGTFVYGISYIQEVTQAGGLYNRDNSKTWRNENDVAFKRIKVTKRSSSFEFVFTQTDDVTITKVYSFADMHVTNPDRMGIIVRASATSDTMVFAANVKISAHPSVGAEAKNSPLYNAVYDAWGDSYTAGDGSYWHTIEQEKGCTANNYGVSGDRVASVLSRINSSTAASGDYVTVLAGVNDYLKNTPMADFRTAVQNVITALIGKSVSAKFAWILPPQIGAQTGENTVGATLEDYVNAIKEICEANSIPTLDLYHAGGWYGTVPAFQSQYMSTDLLHPNALGQDFLAHKIGNFLETL